MRILLLTLLIALPLPSCKKKEMEEALDENLRWMDRTIYLAVPSNANDQDRNNIFQREATKEALTEIASLTGLGDGYFTFKEVEESTLIPSLSPDAVEGEQRSFVMIYPDSLFSEIMSQAGGNTPDTNALTVLNSANKRKFYIIIKASCFSSGSACGGVSPDGLKALIARQLGLIVGLKTRDCTSFPNNVMCPEPSDGQWQGGNKSSFKASFDNALEVILNTPGFYDTFNPNE